MLIVPVMVFADNVEGLTSESCLLQGSNIYRRIFLFYFPLTEWSNYESFFIFNDSSFSMELKIAQENIKPEPSTPPIFESDLIFRIKDIPRYAYGRFDLPVTIQCNKRMLFETVSFVVYRKGQIVVMQGSIKNVYFKDLTDNDYFKNRLKWKYQLYFDIRLDLESESISLR
jgi:hypothetical protein